jgi:hypothetical protein
MPLSRRAALPAACASLLFACSGTDRGDPLELDGDAAAGLDIPAGAGLQAWLGAGEYAEFPAESEVHASTGPHGRVRSFASPSLFESLSAGGGDHPRGAGAVKELYDGDDLRGWAVSVKIADDSAGGEGWYWYEVDGTGAGASPAVDGTGADGCTGCHESGRDYVRLRFPLE